MAAAAAYDSLMDVRDDDDDGERKKVVVAPRRAGLATAWHGGPTGTRYVPPKVGDRVTPATSSVFDKWEDEVEGVEIPSISFDPPVVPIPTKLKFGDMKLIGQDKLPPTRGHVQIGMELAAGQYPQSRINQTFALDDRQYQKRLQVPPSKRSCPIGDKACHIARQGMLVYGIVDDKHLVHQTNLHMPTQTVFCVINGLPIGTQFVCFGVLVSLQEAPGGMMNSTGSVQTTGTAMVKHTGDRIIRPGDLVWFSNIPSGVEVDPDKTDGQTMVPRFHEKNMPDGMFRPTLHPLRISDVNSLSLTMQELVEVVIDAKSSMTGPQALFEELTSALLHWGQENGHPKNHPFHALGLWLAVRAIRERWGALVGLYGALTTDGVKTYMEQAFRPFEAIVNAVMAVCADAYSMDAVKLSQKTTLYTTPPINPKMIWNHWSKVGSYVNKQVSMAEHECNHWMMRGNIIGKAMDTCKPGGDLNLILGYTKP
jgi:hypothetical protein